MRRYICVCIVLSCWPSVVYVLRFDNGPASINHFHGWLDSFLSLYSNVGHSKGVLGTCLHALRRWSLYTSYVYMLWFVHLLFLVCLKWWSFFLPFPIICVQNIRQGRFKINYDAQRDNDKKMLHQLCVEYARIGMVCLSQALDLCSSA